METCANCGVELEANMNFCPLCGEPQIDKNTGNIDYIKYRKKKQEEKNLTAYQKLSASQKRKFFWEISGIVIISGIIVTLIIDLLMNNAITWSKYTITSGIVLFINTTLVCFWLKRLLLLFLGSFISISSFLITLDFFSGNIGWGVKLGIPLVFAAYMVVLTLVILIKTAKQKQLNVIIYSIIASALLCVCIEGIISLYQDNTLKLHWSLIVIACIVPVSAILTYMQYRMKKGTDLKTHFTCLKRWITVY